MTDQPADQNPAQSLKDILEQRLDKVTPRAVPLSVETHPYRRAISGGVIAGILVSLLAGTIFLIKSLA
ncbi:MAG: hypothetical protein ABIQ89_00455 [Candidatus Saccharimonadales bacterium]